MHTLHRKASNPDGLRHTGYHTHEFLWVGSLRNPGGYARAHGGWTLGVTTAQQGDDGGARRQPRNGANRRIGFEHFEVDHRHIWMTVPPQRRRRRGIRGFVDVAELWRQQ